MTHPMINPEKWRISLPLFPPEDVSDNSTRSEYMRCMRLGFYRYGLRRGFEGKNWPIQYGLAYHKYRESIEDFMRERDCGINQEVHDLAVAAASEGWEDPPLGHRHEYLDYPRLVLAMGMARARIEIEQKGKSIVVMRSEDSFDLELPFQVCKSCGWALLDAQTQEESCPTCGDTGHLARARHGGRVDQFIQFNNGFYIRDWKTTGYMPKDYDKKFDPNSQIQGYVWAGTQLSGRRFNGALIETVYNTKTKGPQIMQHYVDFSTGQMEQWIASQMMHEQFIRTAWARVQELGYLAFPQNTAACTSMGLCRFRDACLMGSGREIDSWLESFTIESHWDYMAPDKEEGVG
jgi:predicted RNA-binding Zn-ribbon protein involved in translation (DUF1610 family)